MRRAPVVFCILIGLALPAAAAAHAGHDHSPVSASTSLRQVAKECAAYSPRAEARLHRAEERVLGGEHAGEHARSRAQSRHEACTPAGKVRPSYAARVRRAASVKRVQAVGPPEAVGQWSGPIPMNGIIAIHSTLMPNGKILYYYNNPDFGEEPAAKAGKVMVWDPVTRTGVRRDVPSNIWCAGQTLLADGRVLVVGGNLQYAVPGSSAFKGLKEIWLFDPITETWTQGPDMNHGRWYPTATRLADGRVLITAGWDETGGGASANNEDIEVYTPAADGTGPGTVQVVNHENLDYYPHQFVLPDGRVIIAGPRDNDTYYVHPGSGFALTDAPDLVVNRVWGFGAGVLLPGTPAGSTRVLLIGGADPAAPVPPDSSTATTEQLDTAGGGWIPRASMPDSRRNVNGVILPDGNILAVGGNGQGASDVYRKDALLYSPAANTWTPMATQGQGRGYHSTALLLPDASVVSAGGDTDPVRGIENDIAEIFSPPYLFRGVPGPSIESAPGSVGYGAQFSIGASGQVSRAVLMAPGATTHANDMNQRHVELAIMPAAGGVLAAAPPSSNVAPPGPYMLFLLNAQGVPSAARWVWVGVPVPPGYVAGAGAGAGGAPPGAAAAGRRRIAPPKVKRLRVGVVFTRGAATVRLVLMTGAPFRGTLGLYPVRKGIAGKALKRALVSKKIAGRGGRNVVLLARFSTKGKSFPLKLRLALRLKSPSGGATRIVARSILLRRSPPSARFLG